MSQHHKKDKETRQRRNVDKENSNNKQTKNTTSIAATITPITPATATKLSGISSSGNSSEEKPRKTNNGALPIMNVKQMKPLNKQQKEKLKSEREALVLWRQPIKTLSYCSLEVIEIVKTLNGK